jgi:asparagine synthase (glutamine-hydrolysing)
MCGILAYFNKEGISPAELNASLNSLKKIKHRGPDGEGVVLIDSRSGQFYNLITDETPAAPLDRRVTEQDASALKYDLVLGHRRLSIIDVSTNGHQPMYHNNGNWLIFNGEIYNYIELKSELKELGHSFRTDSDTEVIHVAYEQWKEKCIEKFNGMFSIVIFDKKSSSLFIANDRFGVKPLYYYKDRSRLLLMSEIKQVKEYNINLTLNNEAIKTFLATQYLDYDTGTFYNEISRHQPSTFVSIDLKSDLYYESKSYYSIENSVRNYSPEEATSLFRQVFASAVKLRMRSDVPLGFASSGGLDSSSVLYTAYHLLKKEGQVPNVSTFSAIFPGLDGDESEFIKLIEKDLNIRSHYCNPLEEFNIEDFEKHIYHQDFPVQSTSYYAEWCVARMVNREKVKVLLIGQGGDEALAGYHHHFYRYCRQLILQGKILKYLSLAKKYAELKGMPLNELHRRINNEVKLSIKFKLGLANLGNSLSNKWNKADKLTDLLKMDLQEFMLPTYLRSDDRDGMAFGLETRHPFLDYRLVDLSFALPNDLKIKDGWQKWILRESMTEMPETIRYRKDKKGYTTPQELWVSKNKAAFESYLSYLPQDYQNYKAGNIFLKYSLGAWFKANKGF